VLDMPFPPDGIFAPRQPGGSALEVVKDGRV